MTFEEFLACARRTTYATPTGTLLGDGTSHMSYDDGPWRYRDRYAGLNPYGGQEIVWHDGRPVWIKNYVAEILSEPVPATEIYAFQRRALGQPDPERLMRGPPRMADGLYVYTTDITGNIDRFEGSETITYDTVPVYRMILHGGRLGA